MNAAILAPGSGLALTPASSIFLPTVHRAYLVAAPKGAWLR